MILANRVRYLLQNWNSCSDQYSDFIIQREYRGFLHFFAVYPDVNRVGTSWSLFRIGLILTILSLHWCSLANSAILLYNVNFIYFSTALHYFCVVAISIEFLIHYNLNRKFIGTYHSRIYFNFYDYHEEKTPEIEEIMKWSERRKRTIIIPPLITTSASALIVALAPVLDKYGTFDFNSEPSINFKLPLPSVYFFDSFTATGYCLALFIQLSGVMLCGLTFANIGYMYMVMLINLQIQFKILIHRLEAIESRALALHAQRYEFTPVGSEYDIYKTHRFQDCLKVCLRSCVEHHKVILRNFHDVNRVTGLPIFSIFVAASLIIALAMLGSSFWRLLPGNMIASLVLCVAEASFIGACAYLGQILTDLNEELRDTIYSTKWYNCNKQFCQNIMILLLRTFRPVTFNALGLIKVCNETFGNIINAAYSYYNIVTAAAGN